jgi:hypothetical protein
MKSDDAKNLIGCCGLFCGLCPKYQSKAPSRCIGCGLGEQHSWCSIWNCCVKKRGHANCTECDDVFHCSIFLRRKVAEWIPAADNLRQIGKIGLKGWLAEQKRRQTALEELLGNYNEGRSMNFYCTVCSRMPVDLIQRVMKNKDEKLKSDKITVSDMKLKAAVMKSAIKNMAVEANVTLI